MHTVYIAVGSNMGDRRGYIDAAKRDVKALKDVYFMRESSVLETEPIGGPVQGKYLNAVWQCETLLEPDVLLKELLAIETKLGRVRTVKNAPRTIDLDVLLYDQLIFNGASLTVPHPRMHERAFILQLLCELDRGLMHPVMKKTVRELYESVIR